MKVIDDMKRVLWLVVSLFFFSGDIVYGMNGEQPSSPALRSSGSCGLCDELKGLVVFIACCIHDAPSYLQSAFDEPQTHTFANPYEASASWAPKSQHIPARSRAWLSSAIDPYKKNN